MAETFVFSTDEKTAKPNSIILKRYKLPFLRIEKEYSVDENGKKHKTRTEVSMCEDKDMKKSAAIVIVSSIGFSTLCTGIAKIVNAFKKK